MMSIIPVNKDNARLYSICAMTIANALHFGAYELCRSSISSFITSSSIGFISTITITFVIGCICPCSIIIFYIYRKIYDLYGSQISLRYITMFYAICLSITAIILRYCCHTISVSTSNATTSGATTTSNTTIQHSIAQCTIIVIFILKNSFVQLLYSQHWSFLTSVLSSTSTSTTTISSTTKTISILQQKQQPLTSFVSMIQVLFTKYIIIDDYTSIIAGIGSIVATIFGSIITTYIIHLYQPPIHNNNNNHSKNNSNNNTNENYDNNINENYDGLTCLLICSAFIMMITSYCSEEAYQIANMYQFAPTTTIKESSKHTTTTTSLSLYQRATILFQRIPLLQILCYEVLLCQGVSSLMSYIYVSYMKQSIPYDNERATHTGIVYGRINFGSSILQFAILPFILRRKKISRQYHDQNNNNIINIDSYSNHKNIISSDGNCNGSNVNSHHQQYDNWLWLLLPGSLGIASTIMIYITSYKSLISSFVSILLPSYYNVSLLNVVTVSFCIMKILEYSLRIALIERVYAVLDDDEGKFFGKEINTLVANRFGKSSSALLLAFMTIQYPTTFLLYAPYILVILCCIWFYISIRLIQLLSLSSSSTSLYETVTNQDKVK